MEIELNYNEKYSNISNSPLVNTLSIQEIN